MSCWNCKYYEYEDYEIDPTGNERPFGRCTNSKSEEYMEKVMEDWECDYYEPKERS